MQQPRATRYCALVDMETEAILAVSTRASAVLFLQEAVRNAYAAVGIQYPNYAQDFPIPMDRPESYLLWSWDRRNRRIVATPAARLSEELRERSILANEKLRAILHVTNIVSVARIQAARGFAFQDAIYVTKRMQAQRFKDASYPEEMLRELPYVMQYAEFAHMSPQQAADEILLKARLDDERLAKTEQLRLVYGAKIKKAGSLQELEHIRNEFHRDTVRNSRLS